MLDDMGLAHLFMAKHGATIEDDEVVLVTTDKDLADEFASVRLPLERRVAQLEAALRECVSDLIWCSGSNDFGDGGQARIGWLKGPAQSIERARAALLNERKP